MSEKNADQIKALYTELSKLGPSQNWEKILKVTKKILGLSLTEKKAFQSKIVCLIHLEKFDEAISSIEEFTSDPSEFAFEKAYCEYRLKREEIAYNTLKKCKQMGNRENELMAQLTYKMEKYQESYETYRKLIKNIDDDFDAERQTNLSAVVALLRMANPSSNKDLNMSENENRTYELCYNSACISISKNNYKEAYDKLLRAESMCKEVFEDEQEEPDAFENEVAIIRNQLGFCLQKLGKAEEALKIYKLSEELPSLEEVISKANLDIDTLESQFTLLNSKYGKSNTGTGQGQPKTPKASDIKKRRKKRNVKLPKNCNPALPIDPERWLPLRERSYYKGKRSKKYAIGKGTQGTVSGKDTSAQTLINQSPKPGPSSPEQTTKPKPPPGAQAKSKKKKPVSKW